MFRKSMARLHRVVAHPIVYDYIRPVLVGGVNLSPLYNRIRDPDAVVLDIGCGTGNALRHLDTFQSYLGIDTDPIAVSHAHNRYASSRISFSAQTCTTEDVHRVAPSHVVLAGVLHHLTDDEAVALLSSFLLSPRLQQVLTADIVLLPRHPIGNLLARMDRGRFVRSEASYRRLAERSGLALRSAFIARSQPYTGIGKYLYLTLGPPGPQNTGH